MALIGRMPITVRGWETDRDYHGSGCDIIRLAAKWSLAELSISDIDEGQDHDQY